MSLNEILIAGGGVIATFAGSVLSFKQASKANRISDKTADGAAYDRAMRIYEKTIDLQSQELDTTRASRVVVEARLDLLEEDLTTTKRDLISARGRITDLEQFIMHAGLAVPPNGQFKP